MASICLDFDEIDDGAIPPLCMLCGQPATTSVSRKFSWVPGWVILLILVALLPYIIVSVILTKSRRMSVPLCARHGNHWSWRFWFTLLSFFAYLAVAAAIVGIIVYLDTRREQQGSEVFGLLIVSIPVLFIAWLICVAIVQNTALSASEITDRDIRFKGVAPAFVEAVEALRDQEDERRRQRRPRRPQTPDVPEVKPID